MEEITYKINFKPTRRFGSPISVTLTMPEEVYRKNEKELSQIVGREIDSTTYTPTRSHQRQLWVTEVMNEQTDLGFDDWLDSFRD